jgi:hypothetical protein
MPEWVVVLRIVRFEDKLHFAFILSKMTRRYIFVRTLGERRYAGLKGNSQSRAYRAVAGTIWAPKDVDAIITRVFHRTPK